jgi:hypothetical protein
VGWPYDDVAFQTASTSFPPGSYSERSAELALRRWTEVEGSSLEFSYVGSNDVDEEEVDYGCVSLSASGFINTIRLTDELDPGELGHTWTCSNACGFLGPDGAITMAHISLDARTKWFHGAPDPRSENAPPDSDFYFRPVISHELGHALGLGHSEGAPTTMNSTYPGGWTPGQASGTTGALATLLFGSIRFNPLPDDRAGVRAIYPESTEELDAVVLNFWKTESMDNSMLVPPPGSNFAPSADDLGATDGCRNVCPGGRTPVYFNIGNAGNVDITFASYGAPAAVRFSLSEDLNLDASDTELSTLYYDLPAGATGDVMAAMVDIPVTAAAGKRHVGYRMIPWVGEGYSSNNATFAPGCVHVLPWAPPCY